VLHRNKNEHSLGVLAIFRSKRMSNYTVRNTIAAPFSDRASQILSAVVVVLSGVLAMVTFATI
jgi:hypothetical protein